MSLLPVDIAADWLLFDNIVNVSLYSFQPATEDYADPVTVKGILKSTGESAGLTIADTEVGDGAILDGLLTAWLLATAAVKKLDKLVVGSRSWVVDVSTKNAWETYSECLCRDA